MRTQHPSRRKQYSIVCEDARESLLSDVRLSGLYGTVDCKEKVEGRKIK